MSRDSFTWHLVGGSEIEFWMLDSEDRWMADHVGRSGDSRGLIALDVTRAEAEIEAEAWLRRYGFRRRLALVWSAT